MRRFLMCLKLKHIKKSVLTHFKPIVPKKKKKALANSADPDQKAASVPGLHCLH